jgi:23S rRNA pseudouridine1911/1915/1917 synthase
MIGVGEEMRLQNGKTIDRPGVVHRLDRDTSGVLVLAKNQETFFFLKEQFKNRKIQKTYKAFVWGEVKESTGTINKSIGRSRKDFRLWSATSTAGGKLREAITRWTRLGFADGFSYLALEPKTGRTHQIRVHLKAIGHPVVCDTRYAPSKGKALGFERLALHAHILSLTHPNGTELVLEANYPEDFLRAQELFEKKY